MGHRDPPEDTQAYVAGVAAKILARYRRQKAKERAVVRKLLLEALRDDGARQVNGRQEVSGTEDSLAERREFVEDILNRLKPAERKLLKLRFVEGLRAAEIARRIGCSTEAAYKRIQRTLSRIRSEYGTDPRRPKKPQP